MATLLLDRTTNDLCLDSSKHIAVATDPYATAQNVARAIALRQGDLWYDQTAGVPFAQILGGQPSIGFIKAAFVKAALSVPGVVRAVCFLTSTGPRKIGGQIQVTTDAGVTLPVAF